MNSQELQKIRKTNAVIHLLDVRTAKEYRDVHISGSYHMPLDELDVAKVKILTHDSQEPCVIICHGGARAARAAAILQQSGSSSLHVLEGGISAWMENSGDVVKSKTSTLPLMRQVQLTIGLIALSSSILALTINPLFAVVPAFLGAGLTMAGATGWCGLAILLSRMPWNQAPAQSCAMDR